ncbi:MAG: ComEC/Rec2 family competence protein [Planctomyces sp.]
MTFPRTLTVLLFLWTLVFGSKGNADEKNGRLDVYFIDVEGGAATLLVTPSGESVLIDSGYPDNQGRDLNRIIDVAKNRAGLKAISHAVVSHWHLDHYGNHAALEAAFGVDQWWDRGIPDELSEDDKFHERISAYRGASQNQSKALKAGDFLPLKTGETPLSVRVVTSGREVIPSEGPVNEFASQHAAQPEDPSDNSASLSLLFAFGDFRFLTCGDLTWNVEAQLVTPRNPVGKVDLFMVTHHGLPVSNNPALVLAIDPVTAIMCNGPTKGGAETTMKTLKEVRSLKEWFQLHQNVDLDPSLQAPSERIANSAPTESCKGQWIMASVAPDGKSYTIQIGADGKAHHYQSRTDH